MNKKTLVLGASENSNRYSFIAINRLLENNHSVVAISRKEGEVRGVKFNTSQTMFQDIDTITLYLNKTNQGEFYNYIISLHPKRVIFNPGTENPELENLLTQNNISFARACTLVLLSIGQY